MQFTPQQLTGGPKFHHATRIGNWSEDMELEEIKLKDYLKKKETGSLITTQKQQQLAECRETAELSETPDGILAFGNKVQVVNHQTNKFLSANPFDGAPNKPYASIMINTAASEAPAVRNVFELRRAEDDDGFDDDYVHYGQNIRLALAPFSTMEAEHFLHSELVSAGAAAKFSRHQEVVAMQRAIGETKWQILTPDVSARFELEGEPVPAGEPVVFKHVQTGTCLASDAIVYENLFGSENEVHCHQYQALGKTQNLVAEKKGEITGDYALRKIGLPNVWSIFTATHRGA